MKNITISCVIIFAILISCNKNCKKTNIVSLEGEFIKVFPGTKEEIKLHNGYLNWIYKEYDSIPIYCLDTISKRLYVYNVNRSVISFDTETKKQIAEINVGKVGTEVGLNLKKIDDGIILSSASRVNFYDNDLKNEYRLLDSIVGVEPVCNAIIGNLNYIVHGNRIEVQVGYKIDNDSILKIKYDYEIQNQRPQLTNKITPCR